MNPTAQSDTQSRGKWSRLAWLPILLLLAAIIVARVAGLSESYEAETLRLVLSFIFYTLVSLGILFLIGRSFLASGSPGLLLLECGVVLWSLAGTVGDFVSHGDANINVTIFNIGILLAGLCHLAGAILALSPQRVLRVKPMWLGAGFVAALGALWLLSKGALLGWLPVFFIPGYGGTPVRHAVLISAIAMFMLSAGVLHANQRTARLPFTSWYKLALVSLAVGLFGIMIQLSLGSVVNWLSRTAQWLGGLYLLFASLASLRESDLPLFPVGKKLHPAYYREAVAVAIVFAAAAIRLTFLSSMGTQSPYVVFFPAVTFAAIYGGFRAGLVATVMSAILTDYFWIEPVNQFKIERLSDTLSIVIFLLSGGMIAWVADSMQRARSRASAAETQALLAAEREKTAEALRQSEERFKLSMEATNDGLWDWNAQTDEVYYSPSYNRILGYGPGGFPGTLQAWKERIHPEDLEHTLQVNMDCVEGRSESFALEYRMKAVTGEWRWILGRGKCITRDAQGRATRLIGTHVDITERKRVEEALRESEAKATALIKYAPTGIYEIDYRGPNFVSVNDAMCQLSGYTREELLALGPAALLDDESRKRFAERVGRQLAGEKIDDSVEFRVRKKDGSIIFVTLQIAFSKKKPHVALVIGHDVTERKRTEEALKTAYEEMEKRVQERTYELSGAVERLRAENIHRKQLENTLRESEIQVRFFASQCLTAQETERKRIAGELHDSIAASIAAMKFRIENIAEEMKQGNGHPESLEDVASKLMEINNEVRRIMADLRPSILDDLGIIPAIDWFCREYQRVYSHISVEKQIGISEDEVPNSLKTPIFRISQEAMNNISKYSKASLVNLSLLKEDGKILLTIQDNGKGFNMNTVRRGLGLSTMEERALLSGGMFDLESTIGKGTIIRASWTL